MGEGIPITIIIFVFIIIVVVVVAAAAVVVVVLIFLSKIPPLELELMVHPSTEPSAFQILNEHNAVMTLPITAVAGTQLTVHV